MTALTTDYVPRTPRIAVDHCGTGPLLIFLHGIGGNRTNWHDQLPEFGRHFHAVSWDARGYGASDDYDGPLHFGEFAKDLGSVISFFNGKRAHLVGLSMGGLIALDFYGGYADKVATLTLCDSLPGFGHLDDNQRREFVRLRQQPLLEGKEPKDIAPVVARTLIGASASSRIVRTHGRQHDHPAQGLVSEDYCWKCQLRSRPGPGEGPRADPCRSW